MTRLPVVAALFFAVLGTVSTGLLLLESFDGFLALGIAAVLTAVLARWTRVDEELSARDRRFDLAAVVLALAFAGLQAATSAQNIAVDRDPGVYTVTAKWLTTHSDVDIDTHAQLFGDPGGITYPSAGFGPTTTPNHVYAQGAHVVPAIVSIGGRIGGDALLFRTNALIGGLALLAMYALGRRVVGRGPSLAAAALLALTLPFLAFSRDVYTEPYSQLLLLGGLALLWQARPGRPGTWALAGLVLGGSCLARIDAFLALPFVVAYGALVLGIAADRARAARDVGALLTAAALPAVLGWLDLRELAPGYYRDLHSNFVGLISLLVAAVVASVVLVVVCWTTPVAGWVSARLDRIGTVLAGLVVLVGLVLASRPLWFTSHSVTDGPVQKVIEAYQKTEGVAIDGTRSYGEQSVTWLAWYLGPLLAGAALFGTALLVRRACVRRELATVPFLLVFLSTAGLYLRDPQISPDQIWAMRRYMPVVLPVAGLVGMYAFSLLLGRLGPGGRRLASVSLVLGLLAPVLFLSRPFLTVREYDPQLAEVKRVCAALPDDAALLVVGEFLSARYPMTVRAFCNVPTVAEPVLDLPRATQAFATLKAEGKRLFVLTSGDDLDQLPAGATTVDPAPVSSITLRVWTRVITTPPRQAPPRPRELFLGVVGPQGTISSWVTR
jgi:hypothetical protein